MQTEWRDILWQQFGASLDMLENALDACPEELWSDRAQRPEFWYVLFHTLFFLDYYLSESPEGFAPPPPFTLDEMNPDGWMPERAYTKDELRAYLAHGRRTALGVMGGLDDGRAREPRKFSSVDGTVAGSLLYNMRHLQHHAAQLNLILRQRTDSAPRWVGQARQPLGG